MEGVVAETVKERVTRVVGELEEKLRVRGGLWDDERINLNVLKDVLQWMADEDAMRAQIELEAQAAEEMDKPENKYKETRDIFESYRNKKRAMR